MRLPSKKANAWGSGHTAKIRKDPGQDWAPGLQTSFTYTTLPSTKSQTYF